MSDNADVLTFLLALRAPIRPIIRRSTNMTLALSLDREQSIRFGFLFDRGTRSGGGGRGRGGGRNILSLGGGARRIGIVGGSGASSLLKDLGLSVLAI